MVWFFLAFCAGCFASYSTHRRNERSLRSEYEARIKHLENEIRNRDMFIHELSSQNKALREEVS